MELIIAITIFSLLFGCYLLCFVLQKLEDYRDFKIICKFLKESEQTTHYLYRSLSSIVEGTELDEKTVQRICNSSLKFYPSRDGQKWRLT